MFTHSAGGEGDAEVANPEEAASAKVADRRRISIVRACLISVSICLLIDKTSAQYFDKHIFHFPHNTGVDGVGSFTSESSLPDKHMFLK
jgi:hypothetical protein